ncbi:MAG: hypothetical protein DCF17_01790 [Shackletoniella antarctica]|uniref:Uncharacterized protein n=1 Tax=Shackletoniella antarctica TaxID=268115 RepID=A0A2W4WLL2_9CYAN|nr:MAG: hypothetical protein DCF17_01790 [Shackletoniella antarctica]
MASFVPGQIVFLECSQARLYAEVIQVLMPRQIGWIRPLALVSGAGTKPLGPDWIAGGTAAHQPATPDMLWPLGQLQPAMDTDIMPLLATLSAKTSAAAPSESNPSEANNLDQLTASPAQMTVNKFVQQLWAENPPRLEGDSSTKA